MKKVVFIGSGQHCNVCLYNLKEQGEYEVVAILDSNLDKQGTYIDGIPVLGGYDEDTLNIISSKHNTKYFFIAFGNMKYRKKVFNYMLEQGWEPINIIHPNAVVAKGIEIGKGVLIESGCLITPGNLRIGNNVVVNTGSQVNHDNIIEDNVYIASGVVLSGGVTIKENTLLDDGVIVTLGKTVGKNCLVGAGAVVTKDIEDNVVCYGNPAKVIRENFNV